MVSLNVIVEEYGPVLGTTGPWQSWYVFSICSVRITAPNPYKSPFFFYWVRMNMRPPGNFILVRNVNTFASTVKNEPVIGALDIVITNFASR